MNSLQNIPSVDEMLAQDRVKEYIESYNRDFIVKLIREAINQFRVQLVKKEGNQSRAEIICLLLESLDKLVEIRTKGTLAKVINGTGVVLHTNMGRAPLGERAISYMAEMADSYNNLELDLIKGERGSRYTHVEKLLVEITGAEAALVVNNNAAAVMLGLNTLAKNRQVIVSRGQLVEIGGAFRIPEVMKLSGAQLIEVGTTNKTYLKDFEESITEATGLLFMAHTSNYKIVGFTEEVSLEKLVNLGRSYNLPVMYDLGSGILYDLNKIGIKEEPTVQECIAAGADIITFSGDKLLGGPQAGIIAGKKEYIDAMKMNQLTRALRVDKLTIAALEGTLLEYLSGKPELNIPIISMLSISAKDLKSKAQELYNNLEQEFDSDSSINHIKLVEVQDMIGGGAFPTYHLPGYGVEVKVQGINHETVAKRLRTSQPSLVLRIQDDSLLISARTLLKDDLQVVAPLIKKVLQ